MTDLENGNSNHPKIRFNFLLSILHNLIIFSLNWKTTRK